MGKKSGCSEDFTAGRSSESILNARKEIFYFGTGVRLRGKSTEREEEEEEREAGGENKTFLSLRFDISIAALWRARRDNVVERLKNQLQSNNEVKLSHKRPTGLSECKENCAKSTFTRRKESRVTYSKT